jgi:hypothetical protein
MDRKALKIRMLAKSWIDQHEPAIRASLAALPDAQIMRLIDIAATLCGDPPMGGGDAHDATPEELRLIHALARWSLMDFAFNGDEDSQ